MVFLFRDKAISNIFFLLLLILAVHFHFFITPVVVDANVNDGLFSIVLSKFIAPLNQSVLVGIYLLIVLAQAIRLNIALNNFKMFQNQHYTVAMCYVMLTGFFQEWSNISSALLANSLIIWIFLKLATLSNNPTPKTLLFNTGFISGITIIGYQPTFSLIIITFFALAIVRSFKIAEWIILLIGIIVPYYFLGSYFYLTDNIVGFKKFVPWFQPHLPIDKSTVFIWIALAGLIVLIVSGFIYNQQNANRMVIQIRKSWAVMFILLVLMLPIPFLYHKATMVSAVLSIVPIAAIAANAFSYPKKLLYPNLLFWLSAAVIIYNNWLLVKK